MWFLTKINLLVSKHLQRKNLALIGGLGSGVAFLKRKKTGQYYAFVLPWCCLFLLFSDLYSAPPFSLPLIPSLHNPTPCAPTPKTKRPYWQHFINFVWACDIMPAVDSMQTLFFLLFFSNPTLPKRREREKKNTLVLGLNFCTFLPHLFYIFKA